MLQAVTTLHFGEAAPQRLAASQMSAGDKALFSGANGRSGEAALRREALRRTAG